MKGIPKANVVTGRIHTEETKKTISERGKARWDKWRDQLKTIPWDQLKPIVKRNLFLEEKNFTCELCGWDKKHPVSNKALVQLHHIDGNDDNWAKENLQVLCPNCHSMTENFGMHGRKSKNEYSICV